MESRTLALRINVGCGATPTIGWINFDNSQTLRLAGSPGLADLALRLRLIGSEQREFLRVARARRIRRGDVRKGLPVADGSAEVVYSSHVFEHLDLRERELFLRECLRVLEPGGILRIAVPDLRRRAEQYVSDGDADAFVQWTCLAHPRPVSLPRRIQAAVAGRRNHLWMYDATSLVALLLRRGFEGVTEQAPGQTLIRDPGALDLREREGESIYVEAKRPGAASA